MKMLKHLGSQGTPGRVVVVSSEAHKMGTIDLEDLSWQQRKYSSWGVSTHQASTCACHACVLCACL